MLCMTTVPPSAFGTPALRTEDPRFLRGEGRYLADVPVAGALRAVFVRSMFPHARLSGIAGLGRVRAMPGIVGVYTADDLSIPPQPPSGNVEAPAGELEFPFHREVLVRDRIRFAGEPVAMVIAETAAEAVDAAEMVSLEVDTLEAVVDQEAALAEGSPLLWPELGTNVVHRFAHAWEEDVLAGADVVVEARFVNQRLAPVPMEPNGIAVLPGPGDTWTAWVSTQVPFDVRGDLAELLGVERARVRVIAPDVGGGFGAKLTVYPEYLAIARAAQLLGRPVRWEETRSESMMAMTHGRAQVQRVEIGALRDGTLVGMRAELIGNMGAYPIGAFLPTTTAEMLAGCYRWSRGIAYRGWSVVTNTTPVAAYRGAGRPEAAAMVERAVDMVAAELGMDPVEVRRRNLVPSGAFPFTSAVGTRYDSGDYGRALGEALRLADVDAVRVAQRTRRERGDHVQLGVGVSSYVEITAFPSREFAKVEVGQDGLVTVATGVTPNGQGHETALAQLAGAIFGVRLEQVRVIHSDTGVVARGEGTWASRSLQAGGTVLATRAAEVVARGRELAAQLLEVDEVDLAGPVDGGFRVAGAPDRAVGWATIAGATDAGVLVAEGMERDPGSTFPFGSHVAVVDVDVHTGQVRLLRHVAVDDCGRILNPLLVRGQQHGGIAQGVAQALFEEVLFDEHANPITSTLTGYLIPTASDLPAFLCANTETVTDVNPLGVKGIGESGTVGATPAVQNAVVDALSHLGVRHVDLPCTPERVWRAIALARAAAV
jgi:carbon-monoxide dehydrogenase large subunit